MHFLHFLPLLLLLAARHTAVASSRASGDLDSRSSSSSFEGWLGGFRRALVHRHVARASAGHRGASEKKLGGNEAAGEGEGEEKRMVKVKRKCYYVGTFFHRIDCNAPVNSTSIPSAPPKPTASAASTVVTAAPKASGK